MTNLQRIERAVRNMAETSVAAQEIEDCKVLLDDLARLRAQPATHNPQPTIIQLARGADLVGKNVESFDSDQDRRALSSNQT